MANLFPDSDSTFWKMGRLKTFKHWPFQSSENLCNPERMAAAGFVCIESEEDPDLVECFICSKQLNGWQSDDDPWKEHLKHQSDCPFIQLRKTNEGLWTVNDLFYLFRKYAMKEGLRQLDKAVIKAIEERDRGIQQINQMYKNSGKNTRGRPRNK